MADDTKSLIAKTDNLVEVQRKFLLFQINLSDPSLRSLMPLNKFTDEDDSSTPGDIKFGDPLKYDNPASALYWREAGKPGYKALFQEKILEFENKFFNAVADGTIKLREGATGVPYRDISDLVRAVPVYSNLLGNTENTIQLTLGPDKELAGRGLVGRNASFDSRGLLNTEDQLRLDAQELLRTADIEENDILMVRVSRDGGRTYYPEFMGFVSQVYSNQSYGNVDSINVSVSGVSKLFEVTSIIRQASLNPQQFLAGVEVNDAQTPSVYEHRFNGKNTRQIYQEIMSETLALVPQEQASFKDPNVLAFYHNDLIFSNSGNTGFQNNIFVLLTMDLMSRALVDGANSELSKIFPKRSPGSDTTGQSPGANIVLDTEARAILHHGNHRTYNRMIATGFENFFSQMDTPSAILDEIRGATYYNVFEARDGTIVCSPPRYNKIEVSTLSSGASSEITKKNVTTGDRDINTIFTYNTEKKTWRFNRTADFVIRNEDMVVDIDVIKNDLNLETRVDTQYTWPLVGVNEFPGGSYTDPDLLIRFGLRTGGPVNNPNVRNEAQARLFSPIILGLSNASSRAADVPVRDNQEYQTGKLYYMEAVNAVGHLIGHDITDAHSAVGSSLLNFNMVREVVSRPIQEILDNPNELLNFALCYLRDPAQATDDSSDKQVRVKLLDEAKKVLERMIKIAQGVPETPEERQEEAEAEAAAQLNQDPRAVNAQLAATAAGNAALAQRVKVEMYRYIPSIMDLIVEVTEEPAKAAPQTSAQNTSDKASEEKNRQDKEKADSITQDIILYATDPRFLRESPGKPIPYSVFDQIAKDAGPDVDRPDLQLTKVFPGVGGFRYNRILPINQRQNRDKRDPLRAVSIPMLGEQISEFPGNFRFSQVLANKMATLDWGMKFKVNPDQSSNFIINTDGFPQLYGAVNDVYRLFGTPLDPRTYLENDALKARAGFGRIVPRPLGQSPSGNDFQTLVYESPNALKYSPGSAASFSNDMFEIPSLGQEFNLPAGHLIFNEAAPFDAVLRMRFVKITGGRYKVTQIAPGQFNVIAATPSTFVFLDTPDTTLAGDRRQDGTSRNRLVLGGDIPTTIDQEAASLTGVTITAPDGLFFISPFTDVTVERMMEYSLQPAVIGFRKNSDVGVLLKTTNEALLGRKDTHVKGQGLDLCPQVLFLSSQSDLIPKQALFDRLTTLIQKADFDTSSVETFLNIKSSTVNIGWTYPDGSPGGQAGFGNASPVAAKNYFHLGVSDNEVKAYIDITRRITTGGTVSGQVQATFQRQNQPRVAQDFVGGG